MLINRHIITAIIIAAIFFCLEEVEGRDRVRLYQMKCKGGQPGPSSLVLQNCGKNKAVVMNESNGLFLSGSSQLLRTDGCSWEIPQGLWRGSAQGMMQAHKLWSPSHSAWVHTIMKPSCLILLHTLWLPQKKYSEVRPCPFNWITSCNKSMASLCSAFVNCNSTRWVLHSRIK